MRFEGPKGVPCPPDAGLHFIDDTYAASGANALKCAGNVAVR